MIYTNNRLGIPFASDSSNMEGLAKTSADINWTTHGESVLNSMVGAVGSTIVNTISPTHCVFTAVYDWNIIMASSDQTLPNQCHAEQFVMNT
jgi:hypothetical protein